MAVLIGLHLLTRFHKCIKDGSSLFLPCTSYLKAQMDPSSAVCTRRRQAGRWDSCSWLWRAGDGVLLFVCCCSVCGFVTRVAHQTYQHVKWVTVMDGRNVLWHKLPSEMAICLNSSINNNTDHEHRRSWLSVWNAVKVAKRVCCDDA